MVRFPPGFRLEALSSEHPREPFTSGQEQVDRWLREQALQSQGKRLTSTRVLVAPTNELAGFFTLATGQVDFGDLPPVLAKKLPKRALPVAILAWLGVAERLQGRGFGAMLLAQALNDCFVAGKTFPFIAVILDCVDEPTKQFYARWNFCELPGRPLRLFLSASELKAMAEGAG
ncbi:MAG: hypothetical protein Q8L48_16050 [Archangium sp.]|nr:hypothetical protein [Archangium sp.]